MPNNRGGGGWSAASFLFIKDMKTYKSNTEISLSVRISDKGHVHVRFNPTSNGGSVYTTTNPAIQKGLERHPQFGKLFILESEIAVPKKEEVKVVEEAPAKKVVPVGSLQDAKDYLVETFGISRTQLTSKAKILAQAASHNVEFNGIG